MAVTVSITVSDADAARIADAFDGTFPGRAVPDPMTGQVSERYTKSQWVKLCLTNFLRETVKAYEGSQLVADARQKADAIVPPDVS